MRTILLGLAAASLAVPASMAVPVSSASARWHDYRGHGGDYRHREWRGRGGREYCHRSNGTTGLLVGGAGGALLGRAVDTDGDRTTGTVLGAAAGALLGKSVDSGRRCD